MSHNVASILDFSIAIVPKAESLMGILRAFGDESGKANDPNCPCISMASVIGRVDQWQDFDRRWRLMLSRYDLHYLHMKEVIGARTTKNGPFAKFVDPHLLEAMLTEASRCIIDAGLFGCAMSIATDDLKRSMKKYGIRADPMAFTIYQSVVSIGTWALNNYPEQPSFQLLIDRLDKGTSKIAQAERLYETDSFAAWRGWPLVSSLRPNDAKGSKDMLELQAADLIAWAVRNHLKTIWPWMRDVKPTMPGYRPSEWDASLEKWTHDRLDKFEISAPQNIAYFRVVEVLKIAGSLKHYPYDAAQLENHILKNRGLEVNQVLKAKTIAAAGEYPLQP